MMNAGLVWMVRVVAFSALLAPVVGCSKGVDPEVAAVLAQAKEALVAGRARSALTLLQDRSGPGVALVRTRALLKLNQWRAVDKEIARLEAAEAPDPDLPAIRCAQRVAQEDVRADRLCREALDARPGDSEVVLDLAAAYARTGRVRAAEKMLVELVASDPSPMVREAQIAFFERFSWVREAVEAARAWHLAAPDDPKTFTRLSGLLERKLKGDLLSKRAEEAVEAATELLTLAPEKHAIRYYLADALAMTGKVQEAEAQRRQAKAAGVEPPPPVDSMRGVQTPAEMMKSRRGMHPGHQGHGGH